MVNNEVKNLIAKLRDTQDITFISTAARMEAANLLERIYSQPVELPEPVDNEELTHRHRWVYTTDRLTQAVLEATARVLEAAAKECEARYMGDNNREDLEAKRCASAIRNLIGNVPLRGVK